MSLSSVITVNKDKCVNCHKCIAACPVKYTNKAIGNYVEINPDLCIGCGCCVKVCSHGAREIVDDTDSFFMALSNNTPLVAVVAPAVASSFPNQYLQLNGFLQSIGVSAFFDVSFGAELTIKTYLEYVKSNSPKAVITQPCPALVTYIEIYQPELLKYLAPADSPMMHTIKMIKNFYPAFRNYKIVIVSPCAAKRREFDEVGLGDFNVTLRSLKNYLDENNINLLRYPEIEYYNPSAERAVLFSTPGGLIRTAMREYKGIEKVSRKIEGPELIYNYFKQLPNEINAGHAPLLIDCLNCELGCNGGPGTLNQHESPDKVEFYIEDRNRKMQEKYNVNGGFLSKIKGRNKLKKEINEHWNSNIYSRSYVNRSSNNTIKNPDQNSIDNIYLDMHKYSEADFLNCGACGYGECEKMAIAIYNGLNKKENCYQYNHTLILEMVSNISQSISSLNKQNNIIENKTLGLFEMVQSLTKEFNYLTSTLADNKNLLSDFANIMKSINNVAFQINLLALNAAIEAARAGDAGKGFGVVASEVKRLAEHSRKESSKIDPKIVQLSKLFTEITEKINKASLNFDDTNKLSLEVTDAIKNITLSINTLDLKAIELTSLNKIIPLANSI